jgi:hypothetical protein
MTEKYTVSNYFKGQTKDFLGAAVKKSHLPEGVSVVHTSEVETAQEPYIVVSFCPDWEECREIVKKGALSYFNPYDYPTPDKLAEFLDEE